MIESFDFLPEMTLRRRKLRRRMDWYPAVAQIKRSMYSGPLTPFSPQFPLSLPNRRIA